MRVPRVRIPNSKKPVINGLSLVLQSWTGLGRNIFSEEWDLLVILDTCRPDAFHECVEEFDGSASEIEVCWSTGSATPEWLASTFSTRYSDVLKETTVVTSNPWYDRILGEGFRPEERWGAAWAPCDWNTAPIESLKSVIRAYEYETRDVDQDQPKAPAGVVTDLAIKASRSGTERLIVHYIEPHAPYNTPARQEGRDLYSWEKEPWKFLREGGKKSRVWDAYLTELEYGLHELNSLLRNVSAENAVITSDHGEAFGEWGMYGHMVGRPIPALRRVPWIKTSAEDTGTRTPEVEYSDQEANKDVTDRLKALGYR